MATPVPDGSGPGRPRLDPNDETRAVLIRAPASLWAAVDAAAEDRGQSRAEAVREAVELWLELP